MGYNYLDAFFSLGNKATKGDPLRKAKFDYQLYWIVFLAFVFIATNYYYNVLFNKAPLSTLAWAFVITVFCWFNYWGLVGFRTNYQNMKDAQKILEENKLRPKKSIETEEQEMRDFFEKE